MLKLDSKIDRNSPLFLMRNLDVMKNFDAWMNMLRNSVEHYTTNDGPKDHNELAIGTVTLGQTYLSLVKMTTTRKALLANIDQLGNKLFLTKEEVKAIMEDGSELARQKDHPLHEASIKEKDEKISVECLNI